MSDKWTLTQEAIDQIPAWNERWIKLITSTEPIDREKTAEAIRNMLRVSKLPDNPRFVPVSSPIMGAIVCACAAIYWRFKDAFVTCGTSARVGGGGGDVGFWFDDSTENEVYKHCRLDVEQFTRNGCDFLLGRDLSASIARDLQRKSADWNADTSETAIHQAVNTVIESTSIPLQPIYHDADQRVHYAHSGGFWDGLRIRDIFAATGNFLATSNASAITTKRTVNAAVSKINSTAIESTIIADSDGIGAYTQAKNGSDQREQAQDLDDRMTRLDREAHVASAIVTFDTIFATVHVINADDDSTHKQIANEILHKASEKAYRSAVAPEAPSEIVYKTYRSIDGVASDVSAFATESAITSAAFTINANDDSTEARTADDATNETVEAIGRSGTMFGIYVAEHKTARDISRTTSNLAVEATASAITSSTSAIRDAEHDNTSGKSLEHTLGLPIAATSGSFAAARTYDLTRSVILEATRRNIIDPVPDAVFNATAAIRDADTDNTSRQSERKTYGEPRDSITEFDPLWDSDTLVSRIIYTLRDATFSISHSIGSSDSSSAIIDAMEAINPPTDSQTTGVRPSNEQLAKLMFYTALSVVEAKLGMSVMEYCKRELDSWGTYYNGGSEWSSWISFVSFVRDVIGWKHESQANFKYYEDAAIHGGPRFMHREFVLLSDRAAERHVDDTGRLHREDGPAISWNCGTANYYWHGVLVDEQIVLRPETQTAAQILAEENEEVRRVRIERFGWERFLKESGAKLMANRRNDRDTQREELYELEDGTKRFLCIDPSTGRRYALGVPREVESCEQAQHWMSHGLDQYAVHRS